VVFCVSQHNFATDWEISVAYFFLNLSVNQASGLLFSISYCLHCIDDILLEKSCFADLVKKLKRDSNIGVIGPKIINYNNKFEESSKYLLKKENAMIKSLFLIGALTLIRKDVFFKLGAFDEKFYVYGNDIDLCLKALNRGYYNIFYPSAVIYHKRTKKQRVSDRNMYFRTRNHIWLIRKYFNSAFYLSLLPLFVKSIMSNQIDAFFNAVRMGFNQNLAKNKKNIYTFLTFSNILRYSINSIKIKW